MPSFRWVLAYGILLWLLPFLLSFLIFPLRQAGSPLFDSLMAVILVFFNTLFGVLYLRRSGSLSVGSGALVGAIWLLISVAIDLPIFLGAFGTALGDYLADVAVTYLLIPIVTGGLAAAHTRPGAAKP